MLSVEQLSCDRDRRSLFESLSFTADGGDLIQVTGRNGAGKTTLLRILCGLYEAYEGKVNWQIEQVPLYLGHKPGVKDLLSVEENLTWACGLQGVKLAEFEQGAATALEEVLHKVGLDGYQDVSCGNLSEGQRKRVNLARLYLLDNPVWILDEPFSAIDTEGVTKLETHIVNHVDNGGLVLFTSHQAISVACDLKHLDLSGVIS